MKIALLCHQEVNAYYTATLLTRGHEVLSFGGGDVHPHMLRDFLDCDGCLLLGEDTDLLEIADNMEASGKPIWRQLADVPK